MLDEEKENTQINPIAFVVAGIALLMVIYIIFGTKTDLSITGENENATINIDTLFSTIKDNYTINSNGTQIKNK